MLIYVVTAEPYHENSETIGVRECFTDAEAMVKRRADEYADHDDHDTWNIEEWETATQKVLRRWVLHPEDSQTPGQVRYWAFRERTD